MQDKISGVMYPEMGECIGYSLKKISVNPYVRNRIKKLN
jgi:hypothetical protein